ncbi:YebC/PmpR family DNA-binding regulatory protein [Desulfosalsimonas propionicica]|uniref:Probable transcriptional regulatory protein HNR65_002935 n=1 Tax=Desulfosalsimonas propionicica TaxID=332175 RepID=A0A7W0CBA0_9BACT|nr:YebC/PmpR family DNA-binding transcriptional regulator [Desulfosalsimonas propionicica]MBA2882583.1 YebC/PmpR family DNA-binding regulatory protein [Desulfosalsimonas propionicica]
MAGHSKWANIKHKKGAEDAKRGKIFTKLVKEIIVAARLGGGDPDANPRLRTVLEKAKQNNLPKDNIDRAIKKGTGELEGVNYEETVYEGYGPGGAAVYVESLSDNKNRTVADVRHLFSKHGGNLGENGCVSWMFDKKGWIPVNKNDAEEDVLMEAALEAGAEDIRDEDGVFEVITPPDAFEDVKAALAAAQIPFGDEAEVTMLPQTTVSLGGTDAEKMLKLMNALDDNDDVQRVHTNADIPEEVIAAAG